jgi:ABC-type amino acid transport substrate-binding protein
MPRPGPAARCVLGAALAAAPASGADLPEIKQRGALRVLAVLDTQEPEFFSLRSQAAPGFDVEILLGFAKAHKVELKVVPATGWAGLVPALFEGRGDLVAGRFAATPQRRKLVEFTQEVFPSRNVVVTRRPHPGVATLDQLKAERVGTIAGTGMYEALLAQGIPPARIDSSLGSGELASALRGGQVTAAVWWLEGAIQAQRRDAELELGLLLGPPESLAFGVRREDRALLEALDAHIAVVRSSGTWNRLAVKYFGDAIPTILKRAKEP